MSESMSNLGDYGVIDLTTGLLGTDFASPEGAQHYRDACIAGHCGGRHKVLRIWKRDKLLFPREEYEKANKGIGSTVMIAAALGVTLDRLVQTKHGLRLRSEVAPDKLLLP